MAQLQAGQRVRHWREIRGITQAELAGKAKIEVSKLCRIEQGKIKARVDDIEQIAKALEVSLAEFFGEAA